MMNDGICEPRQSEARVGKAGYGNLIEIDTANKKYMVNGVDIHHIQSFDLHIGEGGCCKVDMSFFAFLYPDNPCLNAEEASPSVID